MLRNCAGVLIIMAIANAIDHVPRQAVEKTAQVSVFGNLSVILTAFSCEIEAESCLSGQLVVPAVKIIVTRHSVDVIVKGLVGAKSSKCGSS